MAVHRPFDLRHVRFEGDAAPRAAPSPPGAAADTRRPRSPRRVASDAPAAGFAARVLRLAGLDPARYRGQPLDRRVGACLRALCCRDEAEADALLARRPELVAPAAGALLLGVTSPFRDEDVFEAMRAAVLPALAQRPGPLRVWSAGCSDGAELLAVAALLADAGLLARAFLLGTDCRPEAIDAARAGRADLASTPAPFAAQRDAWFEPAPAGWRARPAILARVEWRVADVTDAAPAGPWDLVLFRNVAIYLTPEAAAAVVDRLVDAIAPGGFLVVGKAERPEARRLGLALVHRCVYRRAVAAPAGPLTPSR